MADTPVSDASAVWQDHGLRGHVVVAQAEDDFSQVQQSLRTPRVDSSSVDLEKGRDGTRQETFDLREYLTSSNDANSAAGIKHKRVGVTWEDLEVLGIGGEENKVCHFISLLSVLFSLFIFNRFMCQHTQVSKFRTLYQSFFDSSVRCGRRTGHIPFRRPS